MKDHIDKFLKYLEIERAASSHTLRAYRKDLEEFSKFVNIKPEDVELADVRGFIAEQIKSGLNKTSVSRRLASIRSFFKFLYREGYKRTNPAKLVSNPKLQNFSPGFFLLTMPSPLLKALLEQVFYLQETGQSLSFSIPAA